MRRRVSKLIPLLLVLGVLAGCQSDGVNHYTSPQVTGRVLAADTHQPLAGVRISRENPQDEFQPFGPPNGGKQIIAPAPFQTGADGRFVLPAKSVFALFRSPGWWTVPVWFQRSGYETFHTNYTAGDVISNTPAGPPVVDAGDVLLQPSAK